MILLFDLLLVPRRGGESIEIKEREIGNEWRSIGETGQFLEEDKQLTVEFSSLFPKQLGSLVPSAEGFNVTLLARVRYPKQRGLDAARSIHAIDSTRRISQDFETVTRNGIEGRRQTTTTTTSKGS